MAAPVVLDGLLVVTVAVPAAVAEDIRVLAAWSGQPTGWVVARALDHFLARPNLGPGDWLEALFDALHEQGPREHLRLELTRDQVASVRALARLDRASTSAVFTAMVRRELRKARVGVQHRVELTAHEPPSLGRCACF